MIILLSCVCFFFPNLLYRIVDSSTISVCVSSLSVCWSRCGVNLNRFLSIPSSFTISFHILLFNIKEARKLFYRYTSFSTDGKEVSIFRWGASNSDVCSRAGAVFINPRNIQTITFLDQLLSDQYSPCRGCLEQNFTNRNLGNDSEVAEEHIKNSTGNSKV